jgi:hypothetical protein
MGIRVKLLDIFQRLTVYDKQLGIILNGEDNAYPERMEAYINNSVTTKTAVNIMSSYIIGKGFNEEYDKIVVSKKNKTTLLKFGYKVAKSIAKHRGVFIHVNYNLNYKIDSFDVLPYTHCRIGKKDDNKYNGKIGVCSNWNKAKNSDIDFIDVFNENEEVIKAQIDKCKGENEAEKIKSYKGQIWYYNLDEDYDYALSTIDAVYNDCDSEAQASIFKNRSLRKGFYGKTLIVTNPLTGTENDYDTPELYRKALSERKNYKDTIENFIGVENSGGVLSIEKEFNDDQKLEDVFKVIQLDSNIDDKIFEYTESSVFKNILMAFNNLPPALVRSDNALFGSSGEALKEMKKMYQDNTTMERYLLEQIVSKLMRLYVKPIDKIEIIPLFDDVTEPIKVEPIKQENGTDTSN